MREKKSVTRHPKNREHLAHLALAADQAGAGRSAECPDDEAFANLLEADPSAADRQAMVDHVSVCDACFQKWLSLTEALDSMSENETSARSRKRRVMTAAGSACALAVGVMLYLSIDYTPMVKTDMDGSVATEPAELTTANDQMGEAESSGKSPVPRLSMQELPKPESEDKGARFAAKSKSVADEERMEIQVGGERAANLVEQPIATAQSMDPVESMDVKTTAERKKEEVVQEMVKEKSVLQSIKVVSPEADLAPGKKEGTGQFVEQFITLCGDYRDNRLKQTSVEKLIDQGHSILGSGILPADEQPMIEDIIAILEQRPRTGDYTLSEVCERAVEFGRRKGYEVNNMNSQ